MDVHFRAAVRAVHQTCEWRDFAPAVRITTHIGTNALNVIKKLLRNNRFVGVFKDRPFAFGDVMTFLVPEIFARFEIDRVSQIFALFEDVDDNG